MEVNVAHYLVVHTPKEPDSNELRPPTRLSDLARQLGKPEANPRWIRTWSPDLHDDRIFSYWEAINAEDILKAIEAFGFLDEMDAQPIGVREWGPEDVLALESDS
jgi:hypothetical protein